MAEWVIDWVSGAGYAGIVALMFLENVFPPIPSEVIMPLAGYLSSQGKLSLPGVIAAGTLGSVLGALPLYWVAAKLGEDRLANFADRRGRWLTLSREDIERAGRWFDRHRGASVFFGRLVPGLRSLISLPAGVERMPLPSFLLLTTAGSALWSGLLAGVGQVLGSRFERVSEVFDPLSWVLLALIAGGYAWRVATHRGARRAT
jgi:membrane protein DedA with SNARE-associated domain